MWYNIDNNKKFELFVEKYPNHKIPKFRIGEKVRLKRNFYDINKEYVNFNYSDCTEEIDFFNENIDKDFIIESIEYDILEHLIYYGFIDVYYYLGEPCLNESILKSYNKSRLNVYEYLKSFEQFNK